MLSFIVAGVVIDGASLPTVGFSTGWALMIFTAIQFLRGKVLTERDHNERLGIQQAAHDREMAAKDAEIDRVNHDRQEWRAESRLKDVQIAEQNTQLGERDRQLSAIGELGRTVEAVLTAIRPHSEGGAPS